MLSYVTTVSINVSKGNGMGHCHNKYKTGIYTYIYICG